MRTMLDALANRRRASAGGRRLHTRLAPSLAAVSLLLLLLAGCGGDSAQRSAGSEREAGGSSPEQSDPQETIRGTTSRGSTEEAESTVGTVPPETVAESGGDGAAGSASAEQTGEVSPPEPEAPGTEARGETSGEAGSFSGRGGAPRAAANLGGFVASPEASGGGGYGADGILGVRFGDHRGYERVVVDLGSGGQPANVVPVWTLSSPTGDGRLKISFPSVRNTAVSDGSLEEAGAELLDSFYVVRGPEGGMFVDFFAERAFYYRVVELSGPSRVAIDFKAAGSGLDIPLPVRQGNTVLTEPRRGGGITSPMTVSGYSRNPEASNTIILQGPEGATLARETVLSNDWSATWGYFETTLDFPPFTGQGLLKVGAPSARDGSFEGVELSVERAG